MNSRERLENILLTDDAASIKENQDLLFKIIPELKMEDGFLQTNPNVHQEYPPHIYDVWNHTLCALMFSPKDLDIRLALLLHDIGKPVCYTDTDTGRHFYGHPKKSGEIARDILTRLSYDKEYVDRICYLVSNHDNMITLEEVKKDELLEYKRFRMQICDIYAHNTKHPKFFVKESYIDKVKKYFKE